MSFALSHLRIGAQSDVGHLYSWGCGMDGRLGHNDYYDRWEPTRVESLTHAVVTVFAAGDAHSLASISELRPEHRDVKNETETHYHPTKEIGRGANLSQQGHRNINGSHVGKLHNTKSAEHQGADDAAVVIGEVACELTHRRKRYARKLTLHEQQCKAFPVGVYTWGRGAHGRLGHGRNDNRRIPTRIQIWPSSTEGYNTIAAALGGAHTLLLTEKRTHPGVSAFQLLLRSISFCESYQYVGND